MLSEPKANSSRAAFDSYSINPKLWYGVDAPVSEAMRIVWHMEKGIEPT